MSRRDPGDGHIKKITLKSGRTAWRGWLTVGYRANGTPIRRTCQARTREQVREGLVRLRAKYRTDLDHATEATMRLSALFDRYVEHWKAQKHPKTRSIETYQWAIGHAKAQLGDPLAARVTTAQCQDAINRLTLSPASANLVRVVLDGAFTVAVLLKVRPDNPAAELSIPRPAVEDEAPERLTVDAETAQRFLRALRTERLGLAVALTYGTAMRPSEVSALRVADVDLEAGALHVTAAHNVSRAAKAVVRERPKSSNGRRRLELPPVFVDWFHQHNARTRNERDAMGEAWGPDTGLVFVRATDGGPVSGRQLYDVAARVAERLGLSAVGPRVLRRSMLSTLAAAGVDPKVRAAIGGHTTAVTEKHYREVDRREVTAAMGRIAEVIGELGEE